MNQLQLITNSFTRQKKWQRVINTHYFHLCILSLF
uniref:Uncharacterized protein n=1 Tax=Anguilla anguilla TaxID=7936 RepID=A0A0E9WBB9_ANGAN